jgi:uncharacterized protein (TIGR03435 family)
MILKTARAVRLMLAGALSLAGHLPAHAQPDQANPEFEVASIRKNVSGDSNMGAMAQPGGRFGARNVTLRYLIRGAYDVKDFQILAESISWLDTERYDITAKAPEGTPNGFEPMRPMLRTLLTDRFRLAVHRITKEVPAYELGAAKGGLKLPAPRDANCIVSDPRPREQAPFCNNVRMGRGLIDAHGVTMPRLAAVLSDVLGRPVVDTTGAESMFDVHLTFAPDEAIADAILQEQLGLRLQSSRTSVEVLVIDHVEHPAEN